MFCTDVCDFAVRDHVRVGLIGHNRYPEFPTRLCQCVNSSARSDRATTSCYTFLDSQRWANRPSLGVVAYQRRRYILDPRASWIWEVYGNEVSLQVWKDPEYSPGTPNGLC
jgi:hypothetical protein